MKNIIKTPLIFSITVVTVSLIRLTGIPGSSLSIPSIWALGAIIPTLTEKRALSSLGLTRSNSVLSLKYYLLSTLILFPLFGGGLLFCHRMGMLLPRSILPSEVFLRDWIFYQFAVVGIFEELFFRGYLQQQAEKISLNMGCREEATFWIPIVASAFFFGIAHAAVELNPARFVVLFPGLLFAWLRAKAGSLLAPVLSHGSANVFYMLLLNALS